MATSPTMRRLLALMHEYTAEPRLDDSDAAAERDLDYFDRILGILGHDVELDSASEGAGEYRVRWEIDTSALSPLAAARQARQIQLKADSSATVFQVVLRTDTGAEPDWTQAEVIDLTAHRGDTEVLDEITRALHEGDEPTADDIAYFAQLIRLTGRAVPERARPEVPVDPS
jgi:hypothetical protein